MDLGWREIVYLQQLIIGGFLLELPALFLRFLEFGGLFGGHVYGSVKIFNLVRGRNCLYYGLVDVMLHSQCLIVSTLRR